MSITVLDRNGEFFVYLNGEEWKFTKPEEMINVVCFISNHSYCSTEIVKPFNYKTAVNIGSDLSRFFIVEFDNKKLIASNKTELYSLIKKIIQLYLSLINFN